MQSKEKGLKADESRRKSHLGQYFTPPGIAGYMAELFSPTGFSHCHLLDPGAGKGALSKAFIERCASGDLSFETLEVDVFEIDSCLHAGLSKTLTGLGEDIDLILNLRCEDFIHVAVESLVGGLFANHLPEYTHVIINPPYKKIRSNSSHRLALRRAGIETVNLYSAFVALALSLMQKEGQIVAIIPRSFCNGPYYRSFRNYILDKSAIKQIHLFSSRDRAFKDDDVLQENIIIKLERGGAQGDVVISTSTDGEFADLNSSVYPFNQIVLPNDPERFIHIPSSPEISGINDKNSTKCTLSELWVEVSTGPVVDFRVKPYLRVFRQEGTAPMLYPCHLKGWTLNWPNNESKKPNYIIANDNTRKWLYPRGNYCVVRRFSSKEEKRRVYASIARSEDFPDAEMIGFENHLNVFHENKRGLPEELAYGLAVFLNSSVVDRRFRRFNGHTQVNATDLRSIKYPCRTDLMKLGKWAIGCDNIDQDKIDRQLERLRDG